MPPGRRRGGATGGRVAAALLGAALASLFAAGCWCRDPWKAFPERVPPDRSCSTGSVHGHDVYVWSCLRGQHVVVTQYSAEMTCQAPRREASACGELTKLEAELRLTPAMCAGPRPGREWR